HILLGLRRPSPRRPKETWSMIDETRFNRSTLDRMVVLRRHLKQIQGVTVHLGDPDAVQKMIRLSEASDDQLIRQLGLELALAATQQQPQPSAPSGKGLMEALRDKLLTDTAMTMPASFDQPAPGGEPRAVRIYRGRIVRDWLRPGPPGAPGRLPSLLRSRSPPLADDLDQRIESVSGGEDAQQGALLILDDDTAHLAFGHQEGDLVQGCRSGHTQRVLGHDIRGLYLKFLRRTEAGKQPRIPVTDNTYHGAILDYRQVADTMALHQQAQIIDHCAGIRRDGIGSGELFHRNLNGQHGNSPVNHREM